MKSYNRSLIPLFIIAALMFGCDASEDPNLLNPPLPDSTRIRVVNLLPEGDVDVAAPGVSFAEGVPPMQISPVSRVLVLEQTQVIVRRSVPVVRYDTAFGQTLARGSQMTYLILGNNDTTRILALGTGQQEETDLQTIREGKIGFIDAVDDSSGYYIKTGCQSGPVLFTNSYFAEFPRTITTKEHDLSLYLFSTRDSLPITSARLDVRIGAVSYIVAARVNGRIGLYLIGPDLAGTMLPELPQETRTTASVALLNAMSEGQAVSATIGGGSTIATGVPPLTISPSRDIEACADPNGDSLIVTTAGEEFRTPISLAVGSRALVVVYSSDTGAQSIVLDRDVQEPANDSVHIRGVNVSMAGGAASISIGSGAPESVSPDSRPFGTLATGATSGYVRLPKGSYPFMLSSAETGKFFGGGIEELEPGYYTLFVVDDAGTPTLRITRDDIPDAPIRTLRVNGSRATFFNLMPDADATFTVGNLALPPLAYSYVYSTVLPYDIRTIGSNAGSVQVDPALGGYTIGTTGTDGSRKVIAFRAPMDVLPPKTASVRFLNAIPDASDLVMRIGEKTAQPASPLPFGQPTDALQLEARKYSLFVTPAQDTAVRARAEGVELLAGRHYLLVVAPRRQGSTSPFAYEPFWIQE